MCFLGWYHIWVQASTSLLSAAQIPKPSMNPRGYLGQIQCTFNCTKGAEGWMLPRKIPDCKEAICQNNNTHSINKPIFSPSKTGGSLVCLHLTLDTFSSYRMECLLYNPKCMQLLLPFQLGNTNVASLLPPEEEVPSCPCPLWASLRSCTRFNPFASQYEQQHQKCGIFFLLHQ